MTLYPKIQARAQAEIDSVIGSTRLPKVSDRDHLPYVNAVISEVLRCGEIAPMGVPHLLREDDVHNGFLIPKGAIIIPNIWQVFFYWCLEVPFIPLLIGSCAEIHESILTLRPLTRSALWVTSQS